jgi:hypothetical protein
MVITEFKLIEDTFGEPWIRVTYDWENNSDDTFSPYITYTLYGFQDNVQTRLKTSIYSFHRSVFEMGRKKVLVKPGGKVKDVYDIVPIDDINKPLLIELSRYLNGKLETLSFTIEDLNDYK